MTTQIPDLLHYKGQIYALTQEILEDYFHQHPEKRPSNSFMSSAMWRCYVAEFELKDDQLFLLEGDYGLRELFPENGKYTSYSGLIRIDDFRGEFDQEPQDGIFEFLEIVQGNLIRHRHFDFAQLQHFKEQQYGYFLLSDEIEDLYAFWQACHPDNPPSKAQMNRIIKHDIMKHTKEVYVDD